MKHVIICREYPPAPSGGIGTYVFHIADLLAHSGETVHVIGQLWEGAELSVEERCNGRLIVHRVPLVDWKVADYRPSPCIQDETARDLFQTEFFPQSFSWQAGLLTEKLVDQEGIDLIEAQEYEAPLYFFQIRRALNLGPKKSPPCIVHLHGLTEFVGIHNEWNMGLPRIVIAKRLEAYSIAAADALLCPSRYFSRQVEAHFGLKYGPIEVIPLPVGDNSHVCRDKATWEHGTICYLGRLERRKGVIEWIAAAVSVARDYPLVNFEFIGANVLGEVEHMSGVEVIDHLIPNDVKNRFHFRGQQDRSALPKFLAKARMAVVPSRWENFPNTCVEAMSSGIPVIASPEGGMAEMIEDGQTGWIAPNTSSTGLELALRRAIETPAVRLAQMGKQAAADIRKMCDNGSILEHHLYFRRRVAQQGSGRSLQLPENLPHVGRPMGDEQPPRIALVNRKGGLAIIVSCNDGEEMLDECLQSINHQSRSPASVIVMVKNSRKEKVQLTIQRSSLSGLRIIELKNKLPATAKNDGIEQALATGSIPAGFVFLTAYDRIKPNYIETCESVLRHCPSVGLVSSWTRHIGSTHRFFAYPCPAFPYQILDDETSSTTTIRTEAIQEAGFFRKDVCPGYEQWDLTNAVMAAGWRAITIPAVLAERVVTEQICLGESVPPIYSRQRQELLSRISGVVAHYAPELIYLLESQICQLNLRFQFFEKRCNSSFKQIIRSGNILHILTAMRMEIARKASIQSRRALDNVSLYTKSAVTHGIKSVWTHILRTGK